MTGLRRQPAIDNAAVLWPKWARSCLPVFSGPAAQICIISGRYQAVYWEGFRRRCAWLLKRGAMKPLCARIVKGRQWDSIHQPLISLENIPNLRAGRQTEYAFIDDEGTESSHQSGNVADGDISETCRPGQPGTKRGHSGTKYVPELQYQLVNTFTERPELMVRSAGIEPTTPGFGGQYSIH